jgi:Protein of unknown function (DUF3306)
MSDPEHFVARWSRRKRAAQDAEAAKSSDAPDATTANAPAAENEREPGAASSASASAAGSLEPPFDLASLPSIDSITAESDIRAFFAHGVPPELTRAALRRVWTADPKIRDFVGLAENAWDFNAPGAITGFGPLEMTDELRRRVTEMVGRSLTPEEPARPEPTPIEAPAEQATVETSGESVAAAADAPMPAPARHLGISQDEPVKDESEAYNSPSLPQRDRDYVAAQNNPEEPETAQSIGKRLHGRALPK